MVAPENLDLVVQVRILTGQFMKNFKAIVLAAGKGTRMKSETPKVLHKVCGKPVLEYILDITKGLRSLKTYLVVGHGSKRVRDAVSGGVENDCKFFCFGISQNGLDVWMQEGLSSCDANDFNPKACGFIQGSFDIF